MMELAPDGVLERFDSDEAVAGLLQEEAVLNRVSALDPSLHLVEEGRLNKSVLRERAFENSEFREKLEAILHPLVLERIRSYAVSRSGSAKLLLVEVPLLYEVEFPLTRDMDLVVASSRATQLNRLCRDRGLSLDLANRIIDSQMPLETKMKRADLVVWNDGAESSLLAQSNHLIRRCAPLF